MDIIKWVRKNDRKLMAIVVIVILFGFIGGGEVLELLARGGRAFEVGRFAGNRRITTQQLSDAKEELELLTSLGIPQFLRSQVRTTPPNLHGLLLGELLFGERKPDPELAEYMTRLAVSDQYRITEQDLTGIYNKTQPGPVYWLLLSQEAQEAGIVVSNARAAELLVNLLPHITGQTYSLMMQRFIQQGIPERQVLKAFAKLTAVMQYAQVVCSMGDVTSQQVDHLISWDRETLDVNAVVLDAETFARLLDANSPVSDQELAQQLARYKGYYPGHVIDENPFGFGYKIPPRVQLEYLLLKVDQIAEGISRPTRQQAEEYYHRNLQQMFTRTVQLDPNDPNSPTRQQPIPFAEVVDQIDRNWIAEKARQRAREILNEARSMAEIPPDQIEQIEQIRKNAPDFHAIAQQLSDKHKVDLIAGQTGLLTVEDLVRRDRYLGMLTVSGRTQWPLPLGQLVFCVEPIKREDLSTIAIQRPVLYETLGPAQQQRGPDTTGEVMAIVRIVDAVGPTEPVDVNESYDNTTTSLEPNSPRQVFSVRERLASDIRQLRAYQLARQKAEQLAQLVKELGWIEALRQFNQQFRLQAGLDPNGPDYFSIRTMRNQNMVFTGQLRQYERRGLQEPMAMQMYRNIKAQKILTDTLYQMIGSDANQLPETPRLVESKANMRVYCLKDLSVNRYDLDEYAKAKGIYAYQEDFIQAQSVAIVHFDPNNILKRMRFRPTER